MNQLVRKLVEGYKPAAVPLALRSIAGGLRHSANSRPTIEPAKDGERAMTAYLDFQKPTLIHYVRDVKQSAEWYRDMLGFEIGPHEFGSFAEMQLDGTYIFHLVPARERSMPHPYPVFALASQDIESTHAALQARGVPAEPIHWFADYSTFQFRDLDGNAVSVNQHFEIRLRLLEPIQLVGFRLTPPEPEGESREKALQEAARRLRARVGEVAHVLDRSFMVGAYRPSQEHYWVGLQVGKIENVPEGMEEITLPSRQYAVKWHYGLRSDVQRTYRRMDELLDQAGIARDPEAWRVEMTRNWGSKSEEEELEMDLYLAIK